MKAVCPKDSTHNRFVTVAHVTQDWVVDAAGNFIDSIGGANDVIQGPTVGNIWTCNTCGMEAKVLN